ncbi:MAG: hypothetical protein DRO89_00090 [Candidatus Altiarchaeales archaeon]|nr:MAG: hypothetical protein DRO89_00090 [Candidatus Altiarchaeales archaeon]
MEPGLRSTRKKRPTSPHKKSGLYIWRPIKLGDLEEIFKALKIKAPGCGERGYAYRVQGGS